MKDYEFSGNSPERFGASLYMRQVGGGERGGGVDRMQGCHLSAKDVV